jgi:hypothetical protein
MFNLIQRNLETPYYFKGTTHMTLDEAVWAARASEGDYLIEEEAKGVVPSRVVKYRLAEFEMG